ncbi:hypothetical protein [Candidatus Palauibacter sp.]|uniref:hypothetical protein n=1 Tax=Candidatus Palauibacter sp. TaxID=3101350 RepID=UPI003B018CFF
MKLIRQAVAAFAVWAVFLYAWAAVSHLTHLAGPARISSASMGLVADALEVLDPPGALAAPPRLAAAQVRRAADAAGAVHGAIEYSAGAFVDQLGHARAHPRRDVLERLRETLDAQRIRLAPGARMTIRPDARVTIRPNDRLTRTLERRERLWADQTQTLDSGEDVRMHVGLGGKTIWLDAGTIERDGEAIRMDATGTTQGELHRVLHGRAAATEAGRSGPQLSVELDASVDRDKVKKWLEKLLDLLEDLEASDTR